MTSPPGASISSLDVVDRVFRDWALQPAEQRGAFDPRAAGVVHLFVAADDAMRGQIRWRIDNAVYTPTEISFDAAPASADGYRERRRQADDRGLRFFALAVHGIDESKQARDPEPLFVGLAGLALTGGSPDWRDCVSLIDDIHRAAVAIGADAAKLFARAADLATEKMRELLHARATPGQRP